MSQNPRIDHLVANVAAAAAELLDAVMGNDEFLLSAHQMHELQQASVQIATIVYVELGSPDADDGLEGREGKDPSSLTPDQEQGRIEGEARDEINELPDP